jgi:hypothetical protein
MSKNRVRRPRANVARALCEVAILWRPPDQKEKAAGLAPDAAFKNTIASNRNTPAEVEQ